MIPFSLAKNRKAKPNKIKNPNQTPKHLPLKKENKCTNQPKPKNPQNNKKPSAFCISFLWNEKFAHDYLLHDLHVPVHIAHWHYPF